MAHLIPLASSGFPVDVTAEATLRRALGVVKFAVHPPCTRLRWPALLKPENGGSAILLTRLRAHSNNALCQKCVRYSRKPRLNTAIYEDSPRHIVIAANR
jgi:hypothetical protein